MSTLTRGPWTTDSTGYLYAPADAQLPEHSNNGAMLPLARFASFATHADMAAIAAVPELVAALREIVGQENPNRWGYDAAEIALDAGWRERARAALAKVTP